MKRAVSPVVAVALLLVTTVTVAVGFQTWFGQYSSNIFVDIESRGDTDYTIHVQKILGDTLYINTKAPQLIDYFKISDSSGNVMCSFDSDNPSSFNQHTLLLMDFDNPTGATNDRGYYGNNATAFTGGTNLSTGCVDGSCYDFDGIDDQIVIDSTSSLENTTTEMTMIAWVKARDMPDDGGNSFRIIFSKSSSYGSPTWYMVYREDNGRIQNNLAGLSQASSFSTDDEWKLLVTSYDGSESVLYFDAERVDSDSGSSSITTDGVSLKIGEHGGGRPFNGSMDELAIYNKGLSVKEVEALYELRETGFYEQILPDGVKKLNVSTCNLVRGGRYDVSIISNKATALETVIVN